MGLISLEASSIFNFFKKLCPCKITAMIEAVTKVMLKIGICYYGMQ
jgi:hypothetical protein